MRQTSIRGGKSRGTGAATEQRKIADTTKSNRSLPKSGSPKSALPKSTSTKSLETESRQSRNWLLSLLLVLVVGLIVRFALMDTGPTLEQLKLQANQAARAGDWASLESLASQWGEQDPNDFEPWQLAAEAQMQLGDPVKAVEYLQRAPDDSPVELFHQLGFLQMEALGDPLGTLATCQRTLLQHPADSETHERLLFLFAMTAQRNEITQEARRAISVGSDTPTTYAYLFAAKWLTFTNGYETNQTWLEQHPGTELFEVASVVHMPSYQFLDVLAEQAHPDEEAPRPLAFVAEQIRELREVYPKNLELLALETRDLCRAGEVDAVAARLESGHPRAGEDNRFWRYRGWYQSAQNDYEAAIKSYLQALELEPFDWNSRLELAAAIRATEGIEASKEMQELADEGKGLMIKLQKCPDLSRLEPLTLYQELHRHFLHCGEQEMADQLKACLDKYL